MSTPAAEGDTKPDDKAYVCPKCAKKYDKSVDVRTINPTGEEAEKMRETMLAQKAAAAALKPKKRKAVPTDAEGAEPKRSRLISNQTQSGDQTVAAVARKVAASLAEEEKRRKGAMSPAVASLYQAKNPNAKQTFTTMGTFTRVSIGSPEFPVSNLTDVALCVVCMSIFHSALVMVAPYSVLSCQITPPL